MFWNVFLFVVLLFSTIFLFFFFILLIKEVFDEIFSSHDGFEWLAMFALPILTLFATIACFAGCIEFLKLF